LTVKVIFIGGAGRSGSTLVDRVIGQIPGYASAGELRTLWDAGLIENRLCGCGQPFGDCPFWRQVGDLAFGGWSNTNPRDMEAALASLSYVRALRQLVVGSPPSLDPEHSGVLGRLYEGLSAAVAGATIIDSSKGPRYALMLTAVPGIDLRLIHLVRDSRGVAYSWSKEVARPDTPGRAVQMPRFGASAASARWMVQNSYTELLGRRVPVTRLRYETFIENPTGELLRVFRDLGEDVPPAALNFIGPDSARVGPSHTVMGNPMRMTTGELRLVADSAWRTALPRLPRAEVTALTFPLLVRYGYRV
jgi:hypothetical protein